MALRSGSDLPNVGAKRTAHGALAATGQTVAFEPVADGVRPVPPGVAAPIERREDGTVTSDGARELARRAAEARRMPDFGDRTHPWLPPAPELEPFDQARRDLLTQRREEITTLTGGVDSGVGAMLRGWAYLHAAAEYWASQFFATGDPDAYERMVRGFKAVSTEDAKLRDAAVWAAKARPAAKPWWAEPLPPAPVTTESSSAVRDASEGNVEPPKDGSA